VPPVPTVRSQFDVWVSLPIAVLVACCSLGGIFLPSTYARETASWAAQGLGQDWVNLLIVAPALAIAGVRSLCGSLGARLIVGGALLYTTYSFLLYAFAVHFNALFLLYCATLGLSFYGLLAQLTWLAHEDGRKWYRGPVPSRITGAFLLVVAAGFALLWLGQVIPALIAGRDPEGLSDIGLPTNPVHVIDLGLLLPAMAVTGISLLRGGRLGHALGPVLLGFNVFLPLAITGMAFVMHARRVGPGVGLAAVTTGIAIASAALLLGFLGQLHRPETTGEA